MSFCSQALPSSLPSPQKRMVLLFLRSCCGLADNARDGGEGADRKHEGPKHDTQPGHEVVRVERGPDQRAEEKVHTPDLQRGQDFFSSFVMREEILLFIDVLIVTYSVSRRG